MISVHYYAPYLTRSMETARRLVEDLHADEWIAVANHASLDFPTRPSSAYACRSLRHDNTGREFGAYQAGLDADAANATAHWTVFLNDTLGVHSPFHVSHRQGLIEAVRKMRGVDAPVAIGEEERMARSFAMEGCRTHRWLTTHCFALNHHALKALSSRIYCPEVDRLVTGSYERARFFSEALDPILATHVGRWLFEPGAAYSWYAAKPLTPDNCAAMAMKAKCILQEKYVSARLEMEGAWFHDVKLARGWTSRARRAIERRTFRKPSFANR